MSKCTVGTGEGKVKSDSENEIIEEMLSDANALKQARKRLEYENKETRRLDVASLLAGGEFWLMPTLSANNFGQV